MPHGHKAKRKTLKDFLTTERHWKVERTPKERYWELLGVIVGVFRGFSSFGVLSAFQSLLLSSKVWWSFLVGLSSLSFGGWLDPIKNFEIDTPHKSQNIIFNWNFDFYTLCNMFHFLLSLGRLHSEISEWQNWQFWYIGKFLSSKVGQKWILLVG